MPNDNVPSNEIELEFGDGDYLFRLPVAQIGELQTKCGTGVGAIFSRLMAGRYRDDKGGIVLNPLEAIFKFEDITEVLRLGLIGGGHGIVNEARVDVDPIMARKLIERYVHTRPILESWKLAAAVMSAFMIGYSDKKSEAEAAQKKSRRKTSPSASVKDGSTSPNA